MDAPDYSWTELKQMAANRDAWRTIVHSLRDDSRLKITISDSSTKVTTKTAPKPRLQPCASHHKPNPVIKPKTEAVKYRDRDAHEAFFRPRQPPPRRSVRLQSKKNRVQKRKSKVPLTNKQRQQFARDHYALHHGDTNLLHTSTCISKPPTPAAPPTPDTTTSKITTTLTPISWSPTILGHNQHYDQHPSPNQTIPITPPTVNELFQYADYIDTTKGALRDLDLTF